MKALSPEVLSLLQRHAQNPCYLIEIELDEVLHLTTRDGGYEYDSITYVGGKVQGLQVSQERASFGLINEDYKYTTPALLGAYQRAPVKIWWTDGRNQLQPLIEPGYVDDDYYIIPDQIDPILIFDGHVTQFSQITSVLGVVATRSAARRYPTLRVLPPIANFVKPEGSIIQFGNTIFRLEPRD